MKFILPKFYYKDVLNLAIPVVIANIGQTLVQVVDNVMVGQLGGVELAAASFANMLIYNVMIFGMGAAMGLTPNVGYAYVKRDYRLCSRLFQNSLLQNSLFGLVMVIIFFLFSPMLDYFGQPEEVVDKSRSYFLIIGISILPHMIFLSFKQFMDGVGNTTMAMYITIGVNILNVLLNYVLIYGKFGFPEYGMDGAAIATLISRLFMPIIFFIYLKRSLFYRHFLRLFSWKNFSYQVNKKLLSIGLPIASQLVMETFALSMIAIMMGWIGTEEIAAYQIVYTTMTLFFLATNGVSSAITIIISHNFARNNRLNIRNYSISAMQITSIFMFCAGMILLFFGSNIASIYIPDPVIVSLAAKMFVVVAFMEVFDGLQVTSLGVLRGFGDVVRPMSYALICYIIVSISTSYIFGFVLGFGVQGIWSGFAVGVTLAFILFIKRIARNLKMMRLNL